MWIAMKALDEAEPELLEVLSLTAILNHPLAWMALVTSDR